MSADSNIVRRLRGCSRQAYLTFDDGPHPDYTPRVLDILAAAGVRATFFVVGSTAVRHKQLIKRTVADGHETANHTWSHFHPRLLRTGRIYREVAESAHALADITGKHPRYFRPPFGHLRREMTQVAQEQGQTVVLWSLSGKDWGPFGRAALIARRLQRVQAGDIVLLHDARWRYNRPWETLNVLPGFLAQLAANGLKLGLLGSDPSAPGLFPPAAAHALP
jgi:peptidoglycan/xylan/chitin deacetylase (PgdA/CDA1 family)